MNLTKFELTVPQRIENYVEDIARLENELYLYFQPKFEVENNFSRQIVSFQANKTRAFYRWFKYKEAFSASLIESLILNNDISGKILDPFAGIGTTLFAACSLGLDADGIELLPIGQEIIKDRLSIEDLKSEDLNILKNWVKTKKWLKGEKRKPLNELRITKCAYPPETLNGIELYLGALEYENERVSAILFLVLLCILESISYTRKDGQYLRWDYRSGRRQGTKIFDKGNILDFDYAISQKLDEIISDLASDNKESDLFQYNGPKGKINLSNGSCLEELPSRPDGHYDAIITSPPYCNRYDYTRTYALELALLGNDEQAMLNLRQSMISCTVENRTKDLLRINEHWERPIAYCDEVKLLRKITEFLNSQKEKGNLNNNGIPRMVSGYFYEMSCVISECYRILKPNGFMIMVNDNVRYAGIGIPVDTILSAIAEKIGFAVDKIYILPQEKGNSSQQMGEHGRTPLRKCIYMWRKIIER